MRRSTMLLSTGALATTTVIAIALSACGGNEQPPPAQPTATAYPPGAYPPPAQQGYPQQPGYPPAQQPGYPQQTPGAYPSAQQPAPGAPGAETMATPGPLALPCTADNACGLHRCNVQYQKCAFPCQGPVDCIAGNQCLMGVCAPVPATSP